MSNLIKNDKIKIEILKELSKSPKLTPSMLASKIDCKYETASKSLKFLEETDLVKKEVVNHGEKNYAYYQLTSLGEKVSKKC